VAERATAPDAEHPWPWLEAFDEHSQPFFNGRDDDVLALQRCVAAAPVTVLYGKSGLGKTSLLRAGLFPRVRKAALLPVLLRRVDRAGEPGALSMQLLRLLEEAVQAQQLEWHGPVAVPPAATPAEALWELLHDRERTLQGPDGRRWTPLFVLDQFEEVFTLLPAGAARDALLVELGNLLENRVPAAVEARLDALDQLVDRLDFDRHGCRFVISLREDFLPEIDALSSRMPRLQANRCRLRAMTRAQALQAVQHTGGRLVSADAAQQIVDFLSRPAAAGPAGPSAQVPGVAATTPRDEERSIEPALLSLLCASLNAERLARQPPAPTLDVRDLEGRGSRVIEQFYDRAFDSFPPARRAALADWLERELITASGTRRPFPRRDIAEALRGDVDALVGRRLLRYQSGEAGEHVELVHDRLAVVAQARAQLRRQAAEAQLRAERERDLASRRLLEEEKRAAELQLRRDAERADWERERAERIARDAKQRVRTLGIGGAIVLALLLALGVAVNVGLRERQRAKDERSNAAIATQRAEADALQQATRSQLAEVQKERDRHAKVLADAADILRKGGPAAPAKALGVLQGATEELKVVSREAQAQAEQCPSGRRLYPQVGDRIDLALVDRLAPALRRDGFIVLKTEVVEARKMPQRTQLRYFREAEAEIAAAAAASLARAGLDKIQPQYVKGHETSDGLRPCHFELWLVTGQR
jgi:hypothetical protein